ENVLEDGIQLLLYESVFIGVFEQRLYRVEEPQGRIGRVVVSGLPLVGEAIGQHPLVDGAGEGEQDTFGDVYTPGDKRQTGERDHRVAAPIAEPWVSGDDGLQIASFNEELVRRGDQILNERIGGWRFGHDRGAPVDLCSSHGRRFRDLV